MNRLISLLRACKDHPQSVGQTYWEHFRFSASFSLRLLAASFTAITHALIPACFESNTSRSVNELYHLMQNQKKDTKD